MWEANVFFSVFDIDSTQGRITTVTVTVTKSVGAGWETEIRERDGWESCNATKKLRWMRWKRWGMNGWRWDGETNIMGQGHRLVTRDFLFFFLINQIKSIELLYTLSHMLLSLSLSLTSLAAAVPFSIRVIYREIYCMYVCMYAMAFRFPFRKSDFYIMCSAKRPSRAG